MKAEKQFRVSGKEKIKLNEWATAPKKAIAKGDIKKEIAKDIKVLKENQEMLYAQDRRSVLILFQAMDAAGKDSMIEHVMSGVNPQGCSVTSFKSPTSRELDHDYLWRIHREVPSRGDIKIFNRSHYEDVLITRVHPEILVGNHLPDIWDVKDIDEAFYQKRYKQIKHYEDYLADQGVVILKFFLHLSKEEQKKRFIRRIEIPEKNWKFSEADVKERQYWDQYQAAYEQAINATSTKINTWYVIPADDKWYSRHLVSEIINERIEELNLSYPEVTDERRVELQSILKVLEKND
ncbi:polyphosphate kinase 2 family protein [Enterococcus diestrammenae]|uniref:PPK2 family polyphosphate:nucleotide phosphotransferase n=1 Tax=Enterococcus diestrammenae TaxID=1155073 RepID=A0ABV0F2D0_9ENTE|nr:polyphosphate kinase 2 family protein [Enterococcus diestrammenae]KAF1294966.1 phosphate--nucleotide phosphotransferase [Enterococcus diestrammenae]